MAKATYKRIKISQAPGPYFDNVELRISRIEQILQEKEDNKMAQEIYDHGLRDGKISNHSFAETAYLIGVVLGIAIGYGVCKLFAAKAAYGGSRYS